MLYIANFSKPFYLFVDASNVANGAYLVQIGKSNLYYRISFLSKKLSLTQRNYSTIDKEALALITTVRCLKPYLNDNFVVFSDHQPPSFIHKMVTKNQRLR